MIMKKQEPYEIRMHRYEGRSGSGGYTYELTFNKSMEHTGRHQDICDGMNYPRARTWIGRVWNALRGK
jgi:hypothetical protein